MCASSVHGLQGLAQGVKVYPGFAGASLVYGNQGEVRGVTTNKVGLDKQGYMKAGMRFLAKVTLPAKMLHVQSVRLNIAGDARPLHA